MDKKTKIDIAIVVTIVTIITIIVILSQTGHSGTIFSPSGSSSTFIPHGYLWGSTY